MADRICWTPENDRRLLLLAIEDMKIDTKALSAKWEKLYSQGSAPTAMSIGKRIQRLKAANNPVPLNSMDKGRQDEIKESPLRYMKKQSPRAPSAPQRKRPRREESPEL